MKATWIYAALFATTLLSGQEKRPDLIGMLTFQVDSPGGRIENLIVTIGDGGTGPYKAVLMGDSSLPTHAIYIASLTAAHLRLRSMPGSNGR